MRSDASTQAVIAKIYDGAEHSEAWPRVLESVGNLLQAQSAVYTLEDLIRKQSIISVSSGLDPGFQPEYESYYHSVSPLRQRSRSLFAPGRILASHEICSDKILTASEYHQDFLRKYDIFYGLAGVVLMNSERAGLIHFLRPFRMGPFQREERESLDSLLPHFTRAARLHHLIEISSSVYESLELVAAGIVVLGHDGRVAHVNAAAANLLNDDDGITLLNGKLAIAQASEQRRFCHALSKALRTPLEDIQSQRATLMISRRSGRRHYFALITPLPPARFSLLDPPGSVAVFITDPEALPACSSRVLGRMFGLTASEADIALALMKGKHLAEICQELNITRNTARAHLRSIFSAVGVKRQAELVSVLIRTLAFSPVEYRLGTIRPCNPADTCAT